MNEQETHQRVKAEEDDIQDFLAQPFTIQLTLKQRIMRKLFPVPYLRNPLDEEDPNNILSAVRSDIIVKLGFWDHIKVMLTGRLIVQYKFAETKDGKSETCVLVSPLPWNWLDSDFKQPKG